MTVSYNSGTNTLHIFVSAPKCRDTVLDAYVRTYVAFRNAPALVLLQLYTLNRVLNVFIACK